MKLLAPLSFIVLVFLAISCRQTRKKIDPYENLKKELKGVELEKITPHADPGEFEAEVNNGGLNQYFFNSSGQNCFETLRYFKKEGKMKEVKILEEAINLINPGKLSEGELIEKLRKRLVTELDDSAVIAKLDILDDSYYRSFSKYQQ